METDLGIFKFYPDEGLRRPTPVDLSKDSLKPTRCYTFYSSIYHLYSNLSSDWPQFCKKMVAISCDGASVVVGCIGGVGAILRKQQPALVTIHFTAHHLGLSLKDAVKSVKLYDKTINVLCDCITFTMTATLLIVKVVTKTDWAIYRDQTLHFQLLFIFERLTASIICLENTFCKHRNDLVELTLLLFS